MRLCTLFLVVVFAGCNRTTVQTIAVVESATGTDRLVLKGLENAGYYKRDETNPPRIVWQRDDDGLWVDYVTITDDDFPRGLWIARIHSFDPITGIAVLRIQEVNVLETSDNNEREITYSWREWDLRTNKEVRFIRVSDDPTEPFE